MATFAKIDENNIVVRVSTIDDADATTEQDGINFLKSLYGQDTNWVQTKKDGSIRKNFAGIGYTYDQSRDAFIPAREYNSWILDEVTCVWKAPIDRPDVETLNSERVAIEYWDETNQTWKAVTENNTQYTWDVNSNSYINS